MKQHYRTVRRVLIGSLLGLFLVAPLKADHDIIVVGTGDGIAVLEKLGKSFQQINPDATVIIPPSIGSSGGIKAVGTGKYQLGRVAREIKPSEIYYGLSYMPFARIAVAFVVSADVQVENLNAEQVVAIYKGDITDWSEVGGRAGKIRAVKRQENDSSIQALRSTFPGFANIKLLQKAKTATTTQLVFSTLKQTRGVIGFGPYPDAKKAGLKVLSIDGLRPSDPDYPSATTLALIFKGSNLPAEVKEFIDYVASDAAKEVIKSADGIPVKR